MRQVADKLSFRYGASAPWTFRDHSFALAAGDVLAILGPNGRGKTTLLRCLLGLLHPTAGAVRLDGEVGHVPQALDAVFPFSARDMVLMGRARRLRLFDTPGPADYRAADAAIARLGIEHLAARPFPSLSGGERQLVLIARALAGEADILVLDEPTAALDFSNQRVILRTLADLATERRLTVVFSTHDPLHATLVASHALLMHTADDYAFGPAATVLSEAALSRLYGVPLRRLAFDHAAARVEAVVPVLT